MEIVRTGAQYWENLRVWDAELAENKRKSLPKPPLMPPHPAAQAAPGGVSLREKRFFDSFVGQSLQTPNALLHSW